MSFKRGSDLEYIGEYEIDYYKIEETQSIPTKKPKKSVEGKEEMETVLDLTEAEKDLAQELKENYESRTGTKSSPKPKQHINIEEYTTQELEALLNQRKEKEMKEKRQRDKQEEEEGEEEEEANEEIVEEQSGEEEKSYSEAEFLEKGHIHFFYRPRVDISEVHSLSDIQRLNILLIPTQGKMRLLKIPSKILPNVKKHQKKLAIVKKLSNQIDTIIHEMAAKKYKTKTSGEKVIHPARFFASGIYAIIRHKNHSHLAYVLEFPQQITPLHQSFNIGHEGSFIACVKNPNNPSFYKGQSPKYPARMRKFIAKNRKWSPLVPEFLEFEGTELVLIGAKEDIAKELPETGEVLEHEAHKEAVCTTCENLTKTLHLHKEHIPTDPIKGKWV